MTSIRKIVRFLAVGLLVGAGFVATSEASTISVIPGTQTIAPGGTASVDIVLSGLAAGETVGAFSLLLSFNNTILGAPESFTVDPDLKMGAYDVNNDFSLGFSGGFFDVFYLSNLVTFPTEAGLKVSEGTGFRLAHLTFTGLTEGLSPLTLAVSPSTGIFLSNFAGTAAIPATAVNGSVCVDNPNTPGDPCTRVSAVPEPTTLSLLGAGIAAFAARRRRRASRP
jgi:hypothetical protein